MRRLIGSSDWSSWRTCKHMFLNIYKGRQLLARLLYRKSQMFVCTPSSELLYIHIEMQTDPTKAEPVKFRGWTREIWSF